ncbi:hypothetical protein BD410DRAFT_796752 [Rickenella mellea]|uniref:Uncharacterized protein n=1 Tax=Rickenella mellea TaxID=50990 RepID=A0A4Y7PI39_9AGAM|nr:hypothetical protein BD410DRAFT_796752 [Rickenella mellea]
MTTLRRHEKPSMMMKKATKCSVTGDIGMLVFLSLSFSFPYPASTTYGFAIFWHMKAIKNFRRHTCMS